MRKASSRKLSKSLSSAIEEVLSVQGLGDADSRTSEDCAAEIAEHVYFLDSVMTRFGIEAHLYRKQRKYKRAKELEQLVFSLYEVIEESRHEYSVLTGRALDFQLMKLDCEVAA